MNQIVDQQGNLYHVLKKENATPFWAPLAGAGAGFLVAGPVGAIVGGLATYAGWPYVFGKKDGAQ